MKRGCTGLQIRRCQMAGKGCFLRSHAFEYGLEQSEGRGAFYSALRSHGLNGMLR
ncbi:Unknown protein sequence [Pseudomonas syringae pv. aceris]|nr:Unknown protein sequence [Pseudomonas syringae pv. aceris]